MILSVPGSPHQGLPSAPRGATGYGARRARSSGATEGSNSAVQQNGTKLQKRAPLPCKIPALRGYRGTFRHESGLRVEDQMRRLTGSGPVSKTLWRIG